MYVHFNLSLLHQPVLGSIHQICDHIHYSLPMSRCYVTKPTRNSASIGPGVVSDCDYHQYGCSHGTHCDTDHKTEVKKREVVS